MGLPKYITVQILPGLNMVIRITVDDAGFKSLPLKVKKLEQFWSSSDASIARESIATSVQRYWATHIYYYFNQNTGNLGRSCNVQMNGSRMDVYMGQLYHVHKHAPGRGSGKAYSVWEYGRYIRSGTLPSDGAYSPTLGVRTKSGTHPGVAASKYWIPWLRDFLPAARSIYRRRMLAAMKDFAGKTVKRGASESKGATGWVKVGLQEQFFTSEAKVSRGGWK